MDYIALKPCSFGRLYMIGEIIPGSEVLPGMARTLMSMGKIAEYAQSNAQPKQAEPSADPSADAHADATADPSAGAPEDDANAGYKAYQLKKMKKDDLLRIAQGLSLPVTEDMKNDELISAICMAQEIGAEDENGGE